MKRLTWLLAMMLLLALAACADADPTPTPFSAATETPVETTDAVDATETAVPTDMPEPTDAPTSDDETAVAATTADNGSLPGPRADIVNDEGGPVSITGDVAYSNPFFTLGIAAPLVILEDQAGFVDRDEEYIFPVASQALGQLTSDFFESPFSYSVALPIEPKGGQRDVDNDGESDSGVQVFAIAYWNNTFGDPFLEERDLGGGGWSTAYASTRISEDPELEREIIGGTFLVFAPDDQQGFPSGFGDDGLLFTEDDPIVTLPAGYTLVNMDSDPFTFDRSREPVIDLIEPEGAALVDYSDQSYTDAFDALVDQLKNEYAFTEYKGIDWEALRDEFRPRFEEADADGDVLAYQRALRDFAWMIPDGHIAGPFVTEDFRNDAIGGIGMAVRELDDGRIIVTFLLENGPAADAGIELGAEIVSIDDVPMAEYVTDTVSWFGPYSTAHSERLDKLLFSTRFPMGTDVQVAYANPGSNSTDVAELRASNELDSYFYWFENEERDGFELPVEYELLDNGFGYVQIFSFSDNDLLTVQLWERMIRAMNENEVPAIILDMRTNGGGRGFLADQMAAYFFDEPLSLGNTGYWDDERGEFYFNPDYENEFILPAEELRYDGEVVVLVGPACASACEFFSYDMTLNGRATIIGQYPTAGLGGSIDRVAMPDDEQFTFTQGRAVDGDGNIHIEGIGVVPEIVVPVTAESLLGDGDLVLDTAVAFLSGEDVSSIPAADAGSDGDAAGGDEADTSIDGGTIELGDRVSGNITAGTRIRYTINLVAGDTASFIVEGKNISLTLAIYADDDTLLAADGPGDLVGFQGITIDEDVTFILEIVTEDASGGYTLAVTDGS